ALSFTNAARIELKRQGTHVVGVHVGAVDTDMAAAFEFEKLPPAIVAASALDALEADEPEAVVDDYSRAVKAGLSDDHGTLYPQVEHQFLAMTGAGTSATGGDDGLRLDRHDRAPYQHQAELGPRGNPS